MEILSPRSLAALHQTLDFLPCLDQLRPSSSSCGQVTVPENERALLPSQQKEIETRRAAFRKGMHQREIVRLDAGVTQTATRPHEQLFQIRATCGVDNTVYQKRCRGTKGAHVAGSRARNLKLFAMFLSFETTSSVLEQYFLCWLACSPEIHSLYVPAGRRGKWRGSMAKAATESDERFQSLQGQVLCLCVCVTKKSYTAFHDGHAFPTIVATPL